MNAANINQYWTSFNEFTDGIRKLYLNASTSQNYEDVTPLKLQIKELQELANLSTSILPVYDIKRSQHEINTLQNQCNELEQKLQPRQKFRFSDYTMTHFILNDDDKTNKKDVSAPTLADAEAAQALALAQAQARAKAIEMAGSYTISDKKDVFLTITTEEMWKSSSGSRENNIQLLISNCENITVSVRGVLGSVRIENCTGCYLFLGPCSTSCYMESVTGSIVCCSSHQLRIHNTHDCVLYVRTNSHPIIEDCSFLGFAQYELLQYTRPRESCDPVAVAVGVGVGGGTDNAVSLVEDVTTAGLAGANCWDNVVDFKWHKDTASPNFYIMSHSKPTHAIHVLCDNNSDKLPRDQPFTSRPASGLPVSKLASSLVLLPSSWSINVEHTGAGYGYTQRSKPVTAAVQMQHVAVPTSTSASNPGGPAVSSQTEYGDDEDEI